MASLDQHPSAIAEYLAELALRRHRLSGEHAASVLLDQQIAEAVNALLESDASTLDDALALVWICVCGLSNFAIETGEPLSPERRRGIEMTRAAVCKLDHLLPALGARRTFALQADNPLQVN